MQIRIISWQLNGGGELKLLYGIKELVLVIVAVILLAFVRVSYSKLKQKDQDVRSPPGNAEWMRKTEVLQDLTLISTNDVQVQQFLSHLDDYKRSPKKSYRD